MTARARPGFTLLEVAAVLTILSLMTALSVPAFRRWLEEDDLTVATRRVRALMTVARDSAIRGGAPVTVFVDSISGLVWLDAEPAAVPEQATEPTSLELPGGVRVQLSQARARFTFAPAGSAWGDTLVLRTALAERIVTLNPWTGDVVVH
jgi:type IV fimbrial biogenesis protein FimT